MFLLTNELERGHEGRALIDARREIRGPQLVKALPGTANLDFVASRRTDAGENEALRVLERLLADRP
jgi:hypothetical protein